MKDVVMNLAGEKTDFALNDRGLAYGDGVFETILVHDGEFVWWAEHWQRLLRGAEVLRIETPNEDIVLDACKEILANSSRCIIKIILTRGGGGRGYVMPTKQDPRIVISLHPAPSAIKVPVNLRWCETRLSRQPLLAGIKHLNRIEQVLARNEWKDETIFDGLICDTDANVVCATSANVFVKVQGQWLSPKLDQAGIAGIARAWVFGQWPHLQEARISRPEIEQGEAIFICNAVRGILAVNRLGDRVYPASREIRDLQSRLAKEQPAFASGDDSGT
jgi:4-amino-4-deoxychorismate lyase